MSCCRTDGSPTLTAQDVGFTESVYAQLAAHAPTSGSGGSSGMSDGGTSGPAAGGSGAGGGAANGMAGGAANALGGASSAATGGLSAAVTAGAAASTQVRGSLARGERAACFDAVWF